MRPIEVICALAMVAWSAGFLLLILLIGSGVR